MLYIPNDICIGRSLDLYGEYSEAEVEAFRRLVRPGQTVVEAGANIGAHTVFLAQHVGPKGRVIAFEPQRIVYQMLCANLALNNIPNVECRQLAAGAEHGVLKVPVFDLRYENNLGGLALGEYEQGEPVPVVPLDAQDLTQCHFLKVDVEGMEEDVLRGAVGLINRSRPIIFVENDRQDKSESLVRFIDSLGYRIYRHMAALFNPNNFFGNPDDVFPMTGSHNLLCLAKESARNVHGLDEVHVPPLSQAKSP